MFVLAIGESPSGLKGLDADIEGDYSEEAKIQEHERIMQSLDGPLLAPFLEQDLVCDSIGSILASAMGTEYWPGFEAEEENLTQIGKTLTGFLDKLTTDPKSLPKAPLDNSLLSSSSSSNTESIWERGGGVEGTEMYSIPDPDFDELQHVFEVMGFTLPQTLSASAASALSETYVTYNRANEVLNGSSPGGSPLDNNSRVNTNPTSHQKLTSNPSTGRRTSHQNQQLQQTKLKVRLPDGSAGVLIIYPGYDISDQVDAFMVQVGSFLLLSVLILICFIALDRYISLSFL